MVFNGILDPMIEWVQKSSSTHPKYWVVDDPIKAKKTVISVQDSEIN